MPSIFSRRTPRRLGITLRLTSVSLAQSFSFSNSFRYIFAWHSVSYMTRCRQVDVVYPYQTRSLRGGIEERSLDVDGAYQVSLSSGMQSGVVFAGMFPFP